MNRLKTVTSLGLAIVAIAVLAGCSSEPTVVGMWEISEISADGESYSGQALEEVGRSGETLLLTEEGDATWDTSDAVESGTYEYDQESGALSLDVTNQDGQPTQYEMVVDELSSDSLTVSIPDFLTFVFERQ